MSRATAAHIRVSSDKQDTERQEKRIRATRLPITYWFLDAVGKNPRDLPHKRPEFQRIYEDISPRQISTGLADTGVDAICGNGWDKVRIHGIEVEDHPEGLTP
jgi:hypothetical protein